MPPAPTPPWKRERPPGPPSYSPEPPTFVLVLALVVVLEPGTSLAPARLDLHAGAGWRDEAVTRPLSDATASGGAFSDLGLRLFVFPSAHLGAAASLRAGRFTLTPARGTTVPDHVDQSSLDAAAGLAARASLAHLTVEGQLGYGYQRLPVMFVTAGPAGDVRFAGGAMRGHGPHGAASLRLSLGRLGLELGGEARPWIWGAHYAEADVQPRWLAGRGAASVDCCTLGRTRWSVLASYEVAEARDSRPGLRLWQKQRQVGLGLRATWLPPPPPPPPRPPPPPPPPPPRPAAPAPSAISGVVHGQ